MTLNYYLDKPKAEGETAIYLFLRTGKQTIKLNTGQYINPKCWNPKPDRNGNHVNRKYSGFSSFNEWLDGLKKNVHELYNRLTQDNAVSFEELKEAVLGILQKKEVQVTATFADLFRTYIDINTSERSKGTLTKYRVLLNHLENFSNEKNYKLTFESINMQFFDLFRTYLIKEKKHTDNTLWKDFATLKSFMNWALARDLHQNLTFKKFKAPQKGADIIYLTEAELMRLYQADLSHKPKLERVRDVFCFGCFTGQRYSDIANLKKSNIKGDKWHLRTVKTDESHQVPLNAFALAILNKYKDAIRPIPVLSNQKTNDYLKELGKLVGIDEPTSLTKRRGNEKLTNTQPKYEFISTHTARRTFITLSLEKGMRPEVVMRISGHSNYATFKKYIKISEKVTETEMNQIWQMPVDSKS
ncbi:site-specific integrase [Adhaeribacter radiodurans]|uniref:Site-specific integrase n=1 Tax=Adhaeribacter radiodurans TaxID=2745197 RepID=A0A7L7L7F2_9BACT|nr:site-specific integrase [Adhaeribacter radiodurans]QMU28772.1 site-specific integrase [Adhaeribacter radiodurans]